MSQAISERPKSSSQGAAACSGCPQTDTPVDGLAQCLSGKGKKSHTTSLLTLALGAGGKGEDEYAWYADLCTPTAAWLSQGAAQQSAA